MTCYRSRDNWHSYVKQSLSEKELNEMASHLENCSECRSIVTSIQETLNSLAKCQVSLPPPMEIKINVMKAIDKNLYLDKVVMVKSFHLLQLRNWGISMIAAGVLLIAMNLTTLNPSFEAAQMNGLQSELSNQITLPFDKMSKAADNLREKIESLRMPNKTN